MAAATQGPGNEFRDICDPRTERDEGTGAVKSSQGASTSGKCAQKTMLPRSGAREACVRIQDRGRGSLRSGPCMDVESGSTQRSTRVEMGGEQGRWFGRTMGLVDACLGGGRMGNRNGST